MTKKSNGRLLRDFSGQTDSQKEIRKRDAIIQKQRIVIAAMEDDLIRLMEENRILRESNNAPSNATLN